MSRQSLASVSLQLEIIAVFLRSLWKYVRVLNLVASGVWELQDFIKCHHLWFGQWNVCVQTSLSAAPSCSECVRICSISHNSYCPKINVDTVSSCRGCASSYSGKQIFCFLLIGYTNLVLYKPLRFVTFYLLSQSF